MILVCPSCETRYKVDDSSLGDEGRQVKCARCGHVWHAGPEPQLPPLPEPPQAPEPEAPPEPPEAPSEQPAEQDERPPPIPDPRDDLRPPAPPLGDLAAGISIAQEPPSKAPPAGARRGPAGWALLGLAVVGVGLAGYAARDQLIAAWPPAAKLYDALGVPHGGARLMSELTEGGLVIEEVESVWNTEEDQIVLTVRGTVANRSTIERPVPPLVIWLADDADRQLQSWGLTVDAEVLAPGESVGFETSIDNPADDAKRVEIAVLDS